MMRRAAQDREDDSRTPFERFEALARRIVGVSRKNVLRAPRTPRPKPSPPRIKPKGS